MKVSGRNKDPSGPLLIYRDQRQRKESQRSYRLGGFSQHKARVGRTEKGHFQKRAYPVEDAILEINLHASRNVLLLPMINLGEVDANLKNVGLLSRGASCSHPQVRSDPRTRCICCGSFPIYSYRRGGERKGTGELNSDDANDGGTGERVPHHSRGHVP